MMDNQPKGQNLPFLKPEDAQYFDKLLVEVDESVICPRFRTGTTGSSTVFILLGLRILV